MFYASMFLNYIVSEFYLLAFLYLGYVASRLHIGYQFFLKNVFANWFLHNSLKVYVNDFDVKYFYSIHINFSLQQPILRI